MNRKIVGGVIAASLCAAALLYASPYLTLYQIRGAIERKDADAVSEYVDFPALRESVKAQMLVRMQSEMDKPEMKGNPFAGFGQVLAMGLVNKFTETLVSPAGVMLMLENGKPGKPSDVAAAGIGVGTSESGKLRKDFAVDYQGWSRVLVHPKGEQGGFIFKRDGLISWKLVGVRMDDLK